MNSSNPWTWDGCFSIYLDLQYPSTMLCSLQSISFSLLLKFIPKYFILFDAIVNIIAFFFSYKFIYLFIFAVLGLRFCARAFSSCGERGPLFIAVRGPLTITASVVENRLQTRRLSSCGSWAHLLRGMWDPPRPGLEPVSPALAGRLPTTAPPGKPYNCFLNFILRLFIKMQLIFVYSSCTLQPCWTCLLVIIIF